MEPRKTHVAILPQEKLTRSSGGCLSRPRPEDLILGGHEGANPHAGRQLANKATDSAATSSLHPPRVSANTQGYETRKVLTRLDVFKMFKNKKDMPLSERVRIVFEHFGEDYDCSMTKEDFAPVLSTFLCKSNTKYKEECKYGMKLFVKKYQDWLSKVMISGQLKGTLESTPVSLVSPELSTRQQIRSRRKLERPLQEESAAKKIKTFVNSLSIGGEALTSGAAKSIEKLLHLCMESDDALTSVLEKAERQSKPYTPEEALAILNERMLSVKTYNFLHQDLQKRGFPALPPYHKLQEVRKSCRPADITGSEGDLLCEK